MAKRAAIALGAVAAFVLTSFAASGPAQARIRVFTTRVSVSLKGVRPSEKAVKSAVDRQVGALGNCLKGALKGKRRYNGWLWLTFKFNRSGNVRKPVISATVGDNITKTCIKMTMKTWKVGKGGGGNVTVTAKVKK